MRRLKTSSSVLFIVALAFCAPLGVLPATTPVRNASLQISPASLSLDTTHAIGMLRMSSLSARDLVFDLDVVSWTQTGDDDTFTPSSDLVVVPPIYDVQPYRIMLVRVGLRGKAPDLPKESAFQVRFREVAAADSTGPAVTLFAPVFIQPGEPQGEPQYALVRSSSSQARLEVNNASNVHAYLGNVRIRSGEHDVFAGTLDAYVLAGNSRSFIITLTGELKPGEAELINRNGEQENTVNVPVR